MSMKMHAKNSMKYYLLEWLQCNGRQYYVLDKMWGNQNSHTFLKEMYKWYTHFEKQCGSFSKSLKKTYHTRYQFHFQGQRKTRTYNS